MPTEEERAMHVRVTKPSVSFLPETEPSHLWGGTTIWRLINRWLMRNGEFSCILV